jgi:hypothetical protein
MKDESGNDPAGKMRKLLKGGKTSPMTRLPKKDDSAVSFLPHQMDETRATPAQKKTSPDLSGTIQTAAQSAPPSKGLNTIFGPTFWTIASVISLTVNAILVLVLVTLLFNMQRFNVGNALNLGNSFLGGLYTNFEKMDRAHIAKDIPVNTIIPVKFDLQLNQSTNVVLSQDVTIDNAVVTVKTGGLNITNALTTIVLPQGTILPIVLNLTVPVDTTVPVTLNVPVDIPLEQTQLHEPFVGLQDVVRPIYCMINSGAVGLDNQPVCK